MMNRHALRQTLAVALLALASTSTGAATEEELVFSPDDEPFGLSYGEWAAMWWEWALSIPADENPLLDETGEDCANGQEGSVWFLAGPLGAGTFTRTCTVPENTALFFPVVNGFYCAEPDDAPARHTEKYVRNRLRYVSGSAHDLSAAIDGVPVPDLEQYFEESVLFDIVLPPNNIFGATELVGQELTPCADAGYYLMVEPLSAGEHTITFSGRVRGGLVDITYHLLVE